MTTYLLIIYFTVAQGGSLTTEKFNTKQACENAGSWSKSFAEAQFGRHIVEYKCWEIKD